MPKFNVESYQLNYKTKNNKNINELLFTAKSPQTRETIIKAIKDI